MHEKTRAEFLVVGAIEGAFRVAMAGKLSPGRYPQHIPNTWPPDLAARSCRISDYVRSRPIGPRIRRVNSGDFRRKPLTTTRFRPTREDKAVHPEGPRRERFHAGAHHSTLPHRHTRGFVTTISALANCCTPANHSSVRLGTQRSLKGYALRIARAVSSLAFHLFRVRHQLRRRRETNDEEIQP